MKVKSEVAQSRPTLSDPTDSSLPASSVHGIFQERVLEWVSVATCSNILAWRIPWTEEPDGLQSMGSQRVGHDGASFTFGGLETQKDEEQGLTVERHHFHRP
ncbi:unnamed protein product [Rangifer tarandus platyrhynchus]|uniref:Uncharacterized protein n=1 Tax=Rangifer tarandus platyrhynchus TaxID=3082113 RepID=A0ABN8Y8N2_RANTA|nr:unnamed protein product [Rangifer tarandus platyrhynchus]